MSDLEMNGKSFWFDSIETLQSFLDGVYIGRGDR